MYCAQPNKGGLSILFFLIFSLCFNAQTADFGNQVNGQIMHFNELGQLQNYSDNQLEEIVIAIDDDHGVEHHFTIEKNPLLNKNADPAFDHIYSYDLKDAHEPAFQGKLTLGPGVIILIAETEHGLIEKDNLFFSGQSAVTHHHCSKHESQESAYNPLLKSAASLSYGGTLSTFDLVIAVTGEFFQANGNNSGVVNAVVTSTVNAVNLIYQKELSMSFNLVEVVEFTDPSTDPFTGDLLLGTDNRTIQAAQVIDANATMPYDVAHVFHNSSINNADWTDGGVASVEAACVDLSVPESGTGPKKAAGWSGSMENTSVEWIQLVVHELGHMFGATHTFNGIGNSCDSYSIDENTAYEIGSGTTIMAYNGLCSADQNIPSGGALDNYFHPVSLDQIRTYISGLACANDAAIGNTAPTCNANPNNLNYGIPPGTPFELTGTASDPDLGDVLTYSWEPYDEDGSFIFTQGKIGAAAASDASAPTMRSMPPTTSPTRYFPDLETILSGNNNNDDFEALSTVSRTLDFLFVVRDNNSSGGGVCTSPVSVEVKDFLDQFEIASQNTATNWEANGSNMATISWDNGESFPFYDCDDFEIQFSIDGGETFPYILATNIPSFDNINFTFVDSYDIVIPNLPTTVGRIKVRCMENIWFDINNANISIINTTCDANGASILPEEEVIAAQGDPALDLSLSPTFGSAVTNFSGTLESTDDASTLASNNSSSCLPSANPIVYDEYFFQVDASGAYTFSFDGANNNRVFNIYEQGFDPADECSGWIASSADFNGVGINPDDSETLTLSPGRITTLSFHHLMQFCQHCLHLIK